MGDEARAALRLEQTGVLEILDQLQALQNAINGLGGAVGGMNFGSVGQGSGVPGGVAGSPGRARSSPASPYVPPQSMSAAGQVAGTTGAVDFAMSQQMMALPWSGAYAVPTGGMNAAMFGTPNLPGFGGSSFAGMNYQGAAYNVWAGYTGAPQLPWNGAHSVPQGGMPGGNAAHSGMPSLPGMWGSSYVSMNNQGVAYNTFMGFGGPPALPWNGAYSVPPGGFPGGNVAPPGTPMLPGPGGSSYADMMNGYSAGTVMTGPLVTGPLPLPAAGGSSYNAMNGFGPNASLGPYSGDPWQAFGAFAGMYGGQPTPQVGPGVAQRVWSSMNTPLGQSGDGLNSRVGMWFTGRAIMHNLEDVGSQWATATASGKPYYSASMAPEAIATAFTALGAVGGALAGSPWMGAAIGAGVGNVAQATLAPLINGAIANNETAGQYYRMGMNGAGLGASMDVLGAANRSFDTPFPIPASWLVNLKGNAGQGEMRDLYGHVTKAGAAQPLFVEATTEDQLNAFMQFESLPDVRRRRGNPSSRSQPTLREVMEDIREFGTESPDATLRFMRQLAGTGGRFQQEETAKLQRMSDLQYQMGGLGSEMTSAMANSQFGGPSGILGAFNRIGNQQISNIEEQMSMLPADSVAWRALAAQRDTVKSQGKSMGFSLGIEAISASSGLSIFQAEQSPGVGSAYFSEADQLQRLLDVGPYSKNSSTYKTTQLQIENLRRQGQLRDFGVQDLGVELGNTRSVGSAGIAAAYGPGSAGADSLYAQAAAQESIKRNAEEQLRASKNQTEEWKLQHQILAAQAGVQAQILGAQAAIAGAQAVYQAGSTANIEAGAMSRLSLIGGAGGATGAGAYSSMAAQAGMDVSMLQNMISSLIVDRNNPAVQSARVQLAQAQLVAAQADVERATVPMGAGRSADMLRLQDEASAMSMGLLAGGPGVMRSNLRGRIGLLRQHVSELDDNFSHLDPNGPNYDAQRLLYQQQRSGDISSLLSMEKQYNFGWMDRLISATYNAPSGAFNVAARFSHLEAARAGILHPSLGGNLDQIHQMRAIGLTMRDQAIPGGGSPSGLQARAIGAALGGQQVGGAPIEIVIVIKDDHGVVLSRNHAQLNNGKTSFDVNVKGNLASRPGA